MARQGNFENWMTNPSNIRPIAHQIWDPHFGEAIGRDFVNTAFSGLYNWWYTIGFRSDDQLRDGAVFLIVLSSLFFFASKSHGFMKISPAWFKNSESRLNHHLSGLFGLSSLLWAGHLVHVAIPASRGNFVN